MKFGFIGNYENIILDLIYMVWLKQNILNGIDQEIKASKIGHIKRLEVYRKIC